MNSAHASNASAIGNLAPDELRQRLSIVPEGRLLAEIVCSVYWGGSKGITLQQVELLSDSNWLLAAQIMRYRRSSSWSEAQFHAIAYWCRDYYQLSQWAQEE